MIISQIHGVLLPSLILEISAFCPNWRSLNASTNHLSVFMKITGLVSTGRGMNTVILGFTRWLALSGLLTTDPLFDFTCSKVNL